MSPGVQSRNDTPLGGGALDKPTQASPARSAYPKQALRVHCWLFASAVEDRAMHDIVIRGGTIVDGEGRTAFAGKPSRRGR
jgi:hypothetical protein